MEVLLTHPEGSIPNEYIAVDTKIRCWSPVEAKSRFLARYYELIEGK